MYSYYGNKHYFFGGEDVRLDKNRIFEKNVVYLDTDGFTRTEIDLPEYNASMNMLYKGFARGASAIHQGKVWICWPDIWKLIQGVDIQNISFA